MPTTKIKQQINMGRFATELAVAVANADNLPPAKDIKPISLWDAFLPKACADNTAVAKQKKEVSMPTQVSCRVFHVASVVMCSTIESS